MKNEEDILNRIENLSIISMNTPLTKFQKIWIQGFIVGLIWVRQ